MRTEYKTVLKSKLQSRLGREPTEGEEINAENDSVLVMEIVLDKITDLEERVVNLESRRVV